MRGKVFLIGAVVLIGTAGCGRSGPRAPSPAPLSGYTYEVYGAGGWTKGQSLDFRISRNETTAEMKDGRLTVNGKDYGAVADGGSIVVDESGRVLINGNEASPQ